MKTNNKQEKGTLKNVLSVIKSPCFVFSCIIFFWSIHAYSNINNPDMGSIGERFFLMITGAISLFFAIGCFIAHMENRNR